MTTLIFILIGLTAAVLTLQCLLLRRAAQSASGLDGLERALREEQRTGRAELREQIEAFAASQARQIDVLRGALVNDARNARQESAEQQQRFTESLSARLNELTARNEQRLGELRAALDAQLHRLHTDNSAKLEQMRQTVDEKLQSTLNTRLDASFKLVSERLEQVQRGLGEMQQLASGVGDLKRVLGNIKDRGGWGEVQLERLLENTLTREQYQANVAVRPDSAERVDFAIRLPGRDEADAPVWLPIDAKFPREDYERLLDAQEAGDVEAVKTCTGQLERAIRTQARSISGKYIAPPHTTDFALLFLPTEGLYAETLRIAGLVDVLQREHRIVITGPTTLTALLNSLQMGFRTLAIERRSSEVWRILGAVKTEFGTFSTLLENTTRQLGTVQNTIHKAGVRSRAIERQLRAVEALPADAPSHLLEGAPTDMDGAADPG